MLRKRSRSIKEYQIMAASGIHRDSLESISNNIHTGNSSFTVAGLFLGKGPKALSENDSVMSPTSPLDLVKFSSFASPFKAKTGLSIVDSLDDNVALGVVGSKCPFSPGANGKNIVFGPQVRNKLQARVDCHQLVCNGKIKSPRSSLFEIADALEPACGIRAASDFLNICYSCCKELAGEDIYIYRGEKAFCSPSCRELEMVNDEGMDISDNTTSSNHDPDDQESE